MSEVSIIYGIQTTTKIQIFRIPEEEERKKAESLLE